MSKHRVTRRQAKTWLAPMRDAIRQMEGGEINAIRGYPVTRLHNEDDWSRLDYCFTGFRSLSERLWPQIDTTALLRVEKKLTNGSLITRDELASCRKAFDKVEDALTGANRQDIASAVLTELIAIEIEFRKDLANAG